MEGCSRNSFPKQRSCLRCISYQNGFCRRRRQLCGEDADCSFKRRLLIKLMSRSGMWWSRNSTSHSRNNTG